MQRTFLRLEKILSTTSGSLLDPNSVAMIDCLMSYRKKDTGQVLVSWWIRASWRYCLNTTGMWSQLQTEISSNTVMFQVQMYFFQEVSLRFHVLLCFRNSDLSPEELSDSWGALCITASLRGSSLNGKGNFLWISSLRATLTEYCPKSQYKHKCCHICSRHF